jgi:hypothetical protein
VRAPLRLLAAATLALAGCDAQVDAAGAELGSGAAALAASAPPPAPSTPRRLYADRAAGVRFLHPAALRVVTDHWAGDLPPAKFRHEVTLSRDSGPVLRVDVWTDDEGLDLDAWFERHLAFSRVGATAVRSIRAGVASLPALLVDQPRGQGAAQRHVVFAVGGRVVRVTCLDAEDAAARAVLVDVLATFDAEPAR